MKMISIALTGCLLFTLEQGALADERVPPIAEPTSAQTLDQCLSLCTQRWSYLAGGLGANFINECQRGCRAKWPASQTPTAERSRPTATTNVLASGALLQTGESPSDCMYRLTKAKPAAQRHNTKACGCDQPQFRDSCSAAYSRARAERNSASGTTTQSSTDGGRSNSDASRLQGESPSACMYRLTKIKPAAQRANTSACGCESPDVRDQCYSAYQSARANR